MNGHTNILMYFLADTDEEGSIGLVADRILDALDNGTPANELVHIALERILPVMGPGSTFDPFAVDIGRVTQWLVKNQQMRLEDPASYANFKIITRRERDLQRRVAAAYEASRRSTSSAGEQDRQN